MNLLPFKSHLAPIRQHRDAMLERVVKWSETNSGSHNATGLTRMMRLLYEVFSRLPAEITLIDNLKDTSGEALHLRCRPEARLQVFLSGHYDTVYPADHTFQHCTRLPGDRLGGPGVADMKGGLVILLEALKVLEAFPDKSNLGWELLISPDEETGSVGSAHLLEQAAKRNHLGLVFEPALTGGDLARARLGSATFHCTAQGRAAHVGRHYADGRNALFALVHAATKVEQLTNEFPGSICNLGLLEGGGPLNVVPDHGEAHYNIRVARMQDAEALPGRLERIASEVAQEREVKLEFKGGFTRFPKEITPAAEHIFAGISECARFLGFDLNWRDTGGCCDGNNLAAAGLPVIDTLGVRGGHLHSPEEYLEIDSLTERAELTSLFLMALASGEFDWPSIDPKGEEE